jgi:hypothetical protein
MVPSNLNDLGITCSLKVSRDRPFTAFYVYVWFPFFLLLFSQFWGLNSGLQLSGQVLYHLSHTLLCTIFNFSEVLTAYVFLENHYFTKISNFVCIKL